MSLEDLIIQILKFSSSMAESLASFMVHSPVMGGSVTLQRDKKDKLKEVSTFHSFNIKTQVKESTHKCIRKLTKTNIFIFYRFKKIKIKVESY